MATNTIFLNLIIVCCVVVVVASATNDANNDNVQINEIKANFFNNLIKKKTGNHSHCEACIKDVTVLKEHLTDREFIGVTKMFLHSVCQHSQIPKLICTKLIDITLDRIVKTIKTVDAHRFCSEINLC